MERPLTGRFRPQGDIGEWQLSGSLIEGSDRHLRAHRGQIIFSKTDIQTQSIITQYFVHTHFSRKAYGRSVFGLTGQALFSNYLNQALQL
jgi:hypothetical protein